LTFFISEARSTTLEPALSLSAFAILALFFIAIIKK